MALERVEVLVPRVVTEEVAKIPVPKDGKDGTHGKDADEEKVVSIVFEKMLPAIADEVAKIPVPKDGKDGADGKPGTPCRSR